MSDGQIHVQDWTSLSHLNRCHMFYECSRCYVKRNVWFKLVSTKEEFVTQIKTFPHIKHAEHCHDCEWSMSIQREFRNTLSPIYRAIMTKSLIFLSVFFLELAGYSWYKCKCVWETYNIPILLQIINIFQLWPFVSPYFLSCLHMHPEIVVHELTSSAKIVIRSTSFFSLQRTPSGT